MDSFFKNLQIAGQDFEGLGLTPGRSKLATNIKSTPRRHVKPVPTIKSLPMTRSTPHPIDKSMNYHRLAPASVFPMPVRFLFLVATFPILSTACDQQPADHAPSTTGLTAPDTPPDDSRRTYTVRGEVVELPSPGAAGSQFQVHHEAIPGFVDQHGEVVGMSSMTMPFPLGDGLQLDGLELGDKVELDFVVDWSPGRRGWSATRVSELPPDTQLDFSADMPEGNPAEPQANPGEPSHNSTDPDHHHHH